MILRSKPARSCGNETIHRHAAALPAAVLLLFLLRPGSGPCQLPQPATAGSPAGQLAPQPVSTSADPRPDPLDKWQGLAVRRITVDGVDSARLQPLTSHLAQAQGAALNPEDVRRSLRQLFATGLFETIDVEGQRLSDGAALLFHGTPRAFIGTVGVDGAKGGTLNTQLARASQLSAGTRFTQARLAQAVASIRGTLADNGFHEPQITPALTPHPADQLVDIAFKVASGPQARVGAVQVTGTPGMSAEEFRHHAHLKAGAHVDHDTVNRALAGVLKQYRNRDRLEAEIKLEYQDYDAATRRINLSFSAAEGPVVKVRVLGVNLNQQRISHLIPIFEEGAVDEDLLNEGSRRLRDFYQRLGYFDVTVSHQELSSARSAAAPAAQPVEITYTVALGPRRRVEKVTLTGNRYFDSETLGQLLSVHAADTLDRHGAYSQALVATDIGAIVAVYQNNGFAKVKVTPETSTPETSLADTSTRTPARQSTAAVRTAPLVVTYHIDEGPQQRVGTVTLEGTGPLYAAQLAPLLNTTAGQLLSPSNLAADRDEMVTFYLSRGFEHPQVDVTQQPDPTDPAKTDVAFHITEGQQVFVRKVLFTGLHYTHPDTVAHAVTIHAGDPLDQTALQDTQRNLYEFALFNEVDTAVENPDGGDTRKTVLVQAVEARRWALTYGAGFEAQTGTPHYNCGLVILSGSPCNAAGKTGVSPRGLIDITRNNLFGREQSASLQATYGLLEQKVGLLYQIPHLFENRDLGFNVTGEYANSLDVTTYVASRLQAGLRVTEHFSTPAFLLSKANTFIYEFNFRRVKVEAASLQVTPGEITALSTAQRVAGPALTWLRDTRDSVLDAHRGTYTSFQEFLSDKVFGAQVAFNRLDVSNSNYWGFDKGRFVLARNTRYGQERAFGTPGTELIPLPERLYAGGTTSLRGFSINAAGPRDPETGYPTGGAGALINSTEMRLPPPTLPFFGDSLSFVLFHDMGNVFSNAGDAWASALRVRQPDRAACTAKPALLPNNPPSNSTGYISPCSFNYFSHAPGVGLRYHTPAGPIRLDFSYNLNPPVYPVYYNYAISPPGSDPHTGEAGHFNFFFSLGQTF